MTFNSARAVPRANFGGDDERLSIRHDAGSTPAPYVAGTSRSASG